MFNLRIVVLLVLFSVGGIVSSAQAVLSDPMRPPGGYAAPTPVTNGQVDPMVEWDLQSVLLGTERSVAIINGVSISAGEIYQGAKLLKVLTDEVVLQTQAGKKIVLKLTPNIHKLKVSADTEIIQK